MMHTRSQFHSFGIFFLAKYKGLYFKQEKAEGDIPTECVKSIASLVNRSIARPVNVRR